MRWRPPSTVYGRAIIGVVALYALLLQAFLAAATPAMASSPAGILCTHDGSGPPSGDTPVLHDHQCCTAVHAGTIAPPPTPASVTAWARPRTGAVLWRAEAALLTTGPPLRSHSARGPPSA